MQRIIILKELKTKNTEKNKDSNGPIWILVLNLGMNLYAQWQTRLRRFLSGNTSNIYMYIISYA